MLRIPWLILTVMSGVVKSQEETCGYDLVTPPVNSTIVKDISSDECQEGGKVQVNASCYFEKVNATCHVCLVLTTKNEREKKTQSITCLLLPDELSATWNSTMPQCVSPHDDDDDEVPYGNHAIILVVAPSFAVLLAVLFIRLREAQLANS
eukprot:TRINITY_DN9371_c0_g1_i2.p1 TRINITY_DN9371_c0_g1~~TRINITY_DN9371_c0_g1_i2.p1  ORF type:complete len:151 (+),score=14.88 TRINITY_DN9371_c0_g1_i2:28-480(+)